jgi:hypothetical protein
MLRTYYAGGRASLPAPIITVPAGSMNGGGNTYHFWIKARNLVGWNTPSPVTSVVVDAAKNVVISASNFAIYAYEGWKEMSVMMNTTDDFATSRIIANVKLYDADQITLITQPSITLSQQYILTGNSTVTNIAALPTVTLPNGFRIRISNLNNVYECVNGATEIVDNLTVIAGTGCQWHLIGTSLTEVDTNYDKEIYQVVETDLVTLDLPSSSAIEIPTKYYILNDSGNPLSSGQLDLNVFRSDLGLQLTYNVKILGYLNLTTNVLDITGITYVNTVISYPGTKFSIPKDLPVGSALVFEVLPVLEASQVVLPGTYLTLYPRINNYVILDTLQQWSEGVDTLANLKAIPTSLIIDQQSVQVKSVNRIYTYNTDSTLTDDGEGVIISNSNPLTGRWIANSSVILDESVTESKLSPSVLALIEDVIQTNSIILSASQTYTINFDTLEDDYLILTTPLDDGDDTVINFTATTASMTNKTIAIALELRQRTGNVVFDSSILFPGGNAPALSGNGVNDLLLLYLVIDGGGNVKKRATLQQKNIG